MPDVSATEAARRFADLLDAVERGEVFTVIRLANRSPSQNRTRRDRGRDLKAVLNEHHPDPDWAADVVGRRELLLVENRT